MIDLLSLFRARRIELSVPSTTLDLRDIPRRYQSISLSVCIVLRHFLQLFGYMSLYFLLAKYVRSRLL